MVNSFMKNCNNDSLREEIVNEKEYVIYNSVLKYDENKGTKFSTFLGNEAKWTCLNASNKNKKYLELNDHSFDFSELKCENNIEEENFKNLVLENFMKYAADHPDKRVEKIFRMRYASTRKLTPWRKISKQMKLSIQGCINIHNNALNILSKKIKSKYEINS
jgi:DNA-directed RNA polymerase specialized sigma subunit